MLLHCQTLYLESLRFATLQRAFSLFQAISLLIHLSTISADLDMSEIIYATWQNAYCTVGPQNYPREPLIKYVSFRTFSLPKAHIMTLLLLCRKLRNSVILGCVRTEVLAPKLFTRKLKVLKTEVLSICYQL